MPVYDIRGIGVHFPHTAYPCQQDFMDRVLGALQEGENALLESPTGTGKTLCLLSAALAWRSAWVAKAELEALSSASNYENYTSDTGPSTMIDSQTKSKFANLIEGSTGVSSSCEGESFGKRKIPLIIYASRTHSQLAQVVKELRTTVYRPKISVIGSREQLCILPAVKNIGSAGAQQALCQQLIKKKGCQHYTKVGEALAPYKAETCPSERGTVPKLMDIEDLVKFGQKHQACPYFLAREGNADADVLFMPYNYLIDRKTRGSLGLDFENAVIIFDEAHNLEGICGDASSFDITTDDLRASLNEINQVLKVIDDPVYAATQPGMIGPGECKAVQTFILSLISQIQSIKLTPDESQLRNTASTTITGHFTSRADCIFDMIQKCGITNETMKQLQDRIGAVSKLWVEDRHKKGQSGISCHLQILETVLSTLYKPLIDIDAPNEKPNVLVPAISGRDAPAFRVYITEESSTSAGGSNGSGKRRTLSLWCFNPGMALRDLTSLKVRSVILASGTLSPMASFAHELQLPFKYQLENMHVIKPEKQLLVSVLRSGPTDVPLNSSYSQRESGLYKTELGLSIARISKHVPDGLLVFFPSYAVMESCLQYWKTTSVPNGVGSIWSSIGHAKVPFVEPRNKTELPRTMEQYCRAIDTPSSNGINGAIFFAVCRGKLSEGVDFADAKARAVIITGIPFPPIRDPKVMLKKDYLQDLLTTSSRQQDKSSLLSGEEWYGQQAARAVNQAIGRVIRHRHDYGAILFFDDRFSQARIIGQLSKWVRPYLKPAISFTSLCSDLSYFFQSHASHAASLGHASAIESWNREDLGAQNRALNEAKAASTRQHCLSKAREFFKFNPFHLEEKTVNSSFNDEIPSSVIGVLGQFQEKAKNCPTFGKLCHVSGNRDDPIDIAQVEPVVPIALEVEIQHAKDYLEQVRERLPEDGSRKFNILLKSYKAKKMDCASLLDALLILFHQHRALDLAPGFRSFVSPRNRPLFDAKLSAFQSSSEQEKVTRNTEAPKNHLGFAPPGPLPRPHINSSALKIDPVTQRLMCLQSNSIQLGKKPRVTEESSSSSPDPCPICRDKLDKPFRAKCGHVCCFPCWSSWLSNTLECPICRQRTRLSQLSKIYQ